MSIVGHITNPSQVSSANYEDEKLPQNNNTKGSNQPNDKNTTTRIKGKSGNPKPPC